MTRAAGAPDRRRTVPRTARTGVRVVVAGLAWSLLAALALVGELMRQLDERGPEPLPVAQAAALPHHAPVFVHAEPRHAPVRVLAVAPPPPAAAAPAAPRRRAAPRPFATLRELRADFRSPLIMPRLRLPRALAPEFGALRRLAERARPGEPVHVMLSAYCLRGTTRRGTPVRTGIIAADPRVFPMARHVELFSGGRYLGRFRVEDTGGKIRGTRIDIWTPDCADAERFGLRPGIAALVALGEG